MALRRSSPAPAVRGLAGLGLAVAAAAFATVALAGQSNPVLVDLHVMSICPDGVYCKQVFDDVLDSVGSIVKLTNEYIATASSSGITCKHGEEECEGNELQLCVRSVYPNVDQWFNFVLCQDETYKDIPNNAEACASRVGIDLSPVYECVRQQGDALHRTSIALTNARAITKSCTVVIDGEPVCIRDGGRWYNCTSDASVESFVRQICEAYTGPDAPPACR